EPVKEHVYRPDWLEPERVAYTNQLADILAALLPDGVDGSISTVPGCFYERGASAQAIASNLKRSADYFANVAARTNKHITLALEPEPSCMLETITDAIEFFTAHVPDRLHLGLCLDACHTAIEFEDDLPRLLHELRTAEVPIAKLQLSS